MSYSKTFLLFFFILCSCPLYSQPRTNGTDKYKIVARSQSVIDPIGWSYSSYDEKWCACYGLCNDEYKRNSTTPRRLPASEIAGYGDKGIISLQIAKAKANEKNFYLLYHIYWDGEWDYPALQVGWRYYKSCSVWVMTEEEYNKMVNPNIGVNTIQLYDYVIATRYQTQSSQDHLKSGTNRIIADMLETGLTNPKSAYSSYNYKLYVKLEEDGKTVRFKLPTTDMLWSEAQEINAQNELKKQQNKYYYYTPIGKYKCVDFDDDYFEVSNLVFKKLIVK